MVKLQADTSTQGTQWGTGGMATKLTAARIAVAAGTTMVGVFQKKDARRLYLEVIFGTKRHMLITKTKGPSLSLPPPLSHLPVYVHITYTTSGYL